MHPKEMATVWVIRGGERNRMVPAFLRDGSIGLDYRAIPDGRDVDRAKASRLLSSGETPAAEAEVAMFLSFVRRIDVGDIVLMPDPQEKGLACGIVAGDYEYRDDLEPGDHRHRRPVEWCRRLPEAALPERLAGVPRQRRVLDDVADGKLRDLALQCCAGEIGDDPHDRRSPPVRSPGGSRTRKPPRPPKATIPERRCAGCLISKPDELFDDGGDWCRDCL